MACALFNRSGAKGRESKREKVDRVGGRPDARLPPPPGSEIPQHTHLKTECLYGWTMCSVGGRKVVVPDCLTEYLWRARIFRLPAFFVSDMNA